KADKGKLIPNYFTPLEIIGKGDGGAVMISEYQQVVFNSESRVTTYVHGPLAIVDIMPDGNINWVKPISKNQLYHEKQLALGGFFGGISISFAYTLSFIESQTVYHSALFGVRGDKLIVMYNDNPDNQEIEHFRDTKKLVGYLKSVPVVVEIDRDGKMKKSLLEGGKSEVVFRPGVSIQVKQGETIIYGTRRKEEKVGRLTY
ncbi:MAG: hypothetical protein KDD63_24370, partial [Bacteroidetes bacterium]|nr:hypothetical protein [Bacteroidota bacterium]